MPYHSLSHLGDEELVRGLVTLVARERNFTAAVLAHIAEVDARRLYVPAGFPSMHDYCIGELRFSEDAAYKRLQAARAGRRFPAIFAAVAEGRLHLTGLGLLVPHLTEENAEGLLGDASHLSKAEIEQLLVRRFPRTEVLAWEQAIPAARPTDDGLLTAQVGDSRPRVTPLSAESFALQFTIGRGTHDKLAYARALLSHRLPSGDVAEVFGLALEALVERLEKRKFARTSKPRAPACHSSKNPRHIPAHVKRTEEVIPYLRQLGFRAGDARSAAALCEAIPDAPLEQRMRRALSYFHPPGRAM